MWRGLHVSHTEQRDGLSRKFCTFYERGGQSIGIPVTARRAGQHNQIIAHNNPPPAY